MADPGPRARRFAGLVAVELAAEATRRGVALQDLAAAMAVGAPALSNYQRQATGEKIPRGQMTAAHLLLGAERLGISPHLIVKRAYTALLADPGPTDDDSGPPEPGTGPEPTPPAGTVQVPSRPAHARAPAGGRGASGTTSARTGARKRPS